MKDALGAVQSVLVLGGGSDIALATVRALIGTRTRTVVLAARDPAHLKAAAQDLRRAGATTVDIVRFDAEQTDDHERTIDAVFDRHGDIDLVLAAVGVLGDQHAAEIDARAAVAVLRINLLGAVSAIVPVARRLRAQGHGTLVVLSSVAGERARKSNYVYGASKAGLDTFAQGLGDALAATGVQVMVVRPGFVHTKMTAGLAPAPLSTTPETVAAAIVDGLRRGAHTVWVPRVLRWVMALVRHLPRRVFRRLDI